MAPDSNSARGWPPGPWGSKMAGILLFGFSARNSGENWSLAWMSTRCASYGMPTSSSMTDTLMPLGVGKEYSCSQSGNCAGHLRVIGWAWDGCIVIHSYQHRSTSAAASRCIKLPMLMRLPRAHQRPSPHPGRVLGDYLAAAAGWASIATSSPCPVTVIAPGRRPRLSISSISSGLTVYSAKPCKACWATRWP